MITKTFDFIPINKFNIKQLPKNTQLLCITKFGKYHVRKTSINRDTGFAQADLYGVAYVCILEDHVDNETY